MNGKKAKALRRIAQSQTVGFEAMPYRDNGSGGVQNEPISSKGVLNHFKREIKRGNLAMVKGKP